VATCRPPGRVPDLPNLTPLARRHRDEVYNQPGDWDINTFSDEDAFGDHIKIKNTHCLHIGFLNIGGFPTTKGKIKEYYIKIGLSTFDFDIFGMAELNTDWRLAPEDLKLYNRTKSWWESLHLGLASTCTGHPRTAKQFEGYLTI